MTKVKGDIQVLRPKIQVPKKALVGSYFHSILETVTKLYPNGELRYLKRARCV